MNITFRVDPLILWLAASFLILKIITEVRKWKH